MIEDVKNTLYLNICFNNFFPMIQHLRLFNVENCKKRKSFAVQHLILCHYMNDICIYFSRFTRFKQIILQILAKFLSFSLVFTSFTFKKVHRVMLTSRVINKNMKYLVITGFSSQMRFEHMSSNWCLPTHLWSIYLALSGTDNWQWTLVHCHSEKVSHSKGPQ